MKTGIKVMLISMMSMIFLAAAGVVLFMFFTDETHADEEQSIDQMNDYSYLTPEITTDLEDGRFVRIEFQVITDGKAGLKEIEKREFQVRNLLIKEISLMSEEDFSSGLSDLESVLKEKLNEVMEDGTVTDVYTTNKILQ